MDQFVNFLYLTAFVIPAIAGVVFSHFLCVAQSNEQSSANWNWRASAAATSGVALGYFTQYVVAFGVPAVQSLIVAGIVYMLLERKHKGRLAEILSEIRQLIIRLINTG